MSFTAGAGTRFVVTSTTNPSGGSTVSGPFTISGTANTVPLTLSGYSLTGSNAQSLLDLSGTWNTTGTPTAIKLNVTDTASNASSLLMDLQAGGLSRFRVVKNGSVASSGIIDAVTGFSSSGFVSVSSFIAGSSLVLDSANQDVVLRRDAANTLAQRNGTNAQTFRLYNTFTDASNYERGYFTADGSGLTIGYEALGTGVKRPVRIVGPSLASAESVSALDISQTWNTSGTPTALKLNITDTASNASSLLMDLQRSGTSMFSFTKGNRLNIGDASGTGSIRFNTLCGIENQFNNVVIIQNNGNAATFSLVNGATIAASVSAPYVRTSTAYTVATLPAAATAGAGARAYVTDANATTFASVVAGGGANIVPVMSNGTNWIIG